MVDVTRVYDYRHKRGTKAFLVERLWPRGVRKDDLPIDGWLQDVAPSTELRKWYSHDVAKWGEFRRRYTAELDRNADALQPLVDAAKNGNVTLLYSARDTDHNSAVVLRDYLKKLQRGNISPSTSRRRATRE